MKKASLQYAVSTVRWDAEKRLSIEAALRQNVRKPEPFDVLSEEFYETDLVTMDDVMTEEDMRMERKRTIRKTVIALIAAAALCAGGVIASAAMRGRNKKPEVSDSSAQSGAENSASSQAPDSQSSTPANIIAELHLPLTDQQDEPSLRRQEVYLDAYGYAASETGWYYTEAGMDINGKRVDPMWYSDNDTGECVMFCARANCLHDGNEYCTATTYAYLRLSAPVWLDGYVYALAKKPYGKNLSPYAQYGGDETAGSVVILRYAPDGSEITEIAEVYPQTEEAVTIGFNGADLIAHRGQLWYAFRGQLVNHDSFAASEFYNAGVFSPQDGTVTGLLGDDTTQSFSFSQKGAPMNLVGDGDYVYFKFDAAGKWNDANKLRTGIWRISCVTGGMEQVYSCDSNNLPQRYAVTGDRIVMYTVTSPRTEVFINECRVYSVSAREEKTLFKEDTRENPEAAKFLGFCADESYIYLETTDACLRILDYDGNCKTMPLPTDLEWKNCNQRMHETMLYMEEGDSTLSVFDYSIMLHDGKLCVRYLLNWYSLPVSEVLRGSSDWQPAFSTDKWRYLK